MSDSIPLSPEHGLRPVIATCPNCGKPSNEIALVGNGRVYKCVQCGRETLAYKRPKKCEVCANTSFESQPFDETMPVFGALCDECEKEKKEHAEIVKQGGVYWSCSDCGRNGVIKPGEFAVLVRETCKVAPPKSCGVEFSKNSTPPCPACGDKEDNG